MATVQGDFTNDAEARHAKEALIQAGIAENRIRIWNIIPPSEPLRNPGNATLTGAALGEAYGGTVGLVAGAAIGTAIGGYSNEEPPLPDPSGVRVVVDAESDTRHIETLLESIGASNVQEGLT